jgi:hypothetical protein
VSRDFSILVFFLSKSVTPQPQSIPEEPFRIFSKIRGDIRSSRLTTGVVGKFAAGIVDTGGNLPPVSTTLVKLVAKFAGGVVDTGGQP